MAGTAPAGSAYRVYGRRKIKAAPRREHGLVVDEDRIARWMGELGICGATRSKTTITTRPGRSSVHSRKIVATYVKSDTHNSRR